MDVLISVGAVPGGVRETVVRRRENGGCRDKCIFDTFGQHYLNGAGVRPQTPEDAPPLAGFNMKSLVAYDQNLRPKI